jgi:hypothetical protein
MNGEVLLVGSVPLPSAEEVLATSAGYLGDYASCLPDGEFGPRSSWIGYLAKEIYAHHPDIETLQRLDESRPTSLKDTSNVWSFRIRPGVSDLRIDTRYADIALDSYASFRKLRDAGSIAPGVRFQVCFPSTGSAFKTYFQDSNEWPRLARAYEASVRRDIGRLVSEIGVQDLAVQLDVCIEMRDMQNNIPWSPPRETKFEEAVDTVTTLGSYVPAGVPLGIHWCYGTLGGWPMVRIESLDLCTRLTNAAARRAVRPIDYAHFPVLRQADEQYFEPLDHLDAGDLKLYLGLIHHSDGMEGVQRRMHAALRHARGDVGVASVCGYGRLTREQTMGVFDLHKQAGQYVRALRGS